MLTAEIKVNGVMIAHLYINNRGPTHAAVHADDDRMAEERLYVCELYTPTKPLRSCELIHVRSDGPGELVRKALGMLGDVPLA